MEDKNTAMRILEVVNKLGGNMSEFARKIDVTPAYISKLGKQPEKCRPSGLVISSICREFNVNRDWLVTGEGEMFAPVAQDQSVFNFVKDALQSPTDSFKFRFITALPSLAEADWTTLEKLSVLFGKPS